MERNVVPMHQKNIVDWFCLINSKGVGPKTFWEMIKKYGSAEASLDHISDPFPIKEAKKILNAFKGYVLLASDSVFPRELKRDSSCPPMLFARGDLSILQCRKVAIIGARNASMSGKSMASTLGCDLSHHYAIVSGLANGIDTSAHFGALKNEKAKVIAVMPFSLDNVYPKENKNLFQKIVDRGVVITEVSPHRAPDQGMFHIRNKIIASMSSGIVVVEAALKSGTMSTAKLALDLGVEVMAVPGSPADPRARGCNYLIKNGSALIESYIDVLENMNIETLKENVKLEYSFKNQCNGQCGDLNQKILDMLSVDCPINIELIAANLDMNIADVLCHISELEMQRRIKKYSVNEVVLNA